MASSTNTRIHRYFSWPILNCPFPVPGRLCADEAVPPVVPCGPVDCMFDGEPDGLVARVNERLIVPGFATARI
jgi:hypothetical protein